MSFPFTIRKVIYPEEKHVWARVRILHEAEGAILADNGRRIWIPKARIKAIRLKGKTFEVYVGESVVG